MAEIAGPYAPVSPPLVVPPVINLVASARQPADETGGRWVLGFAFQGGVDADPTNIDPCDSANVDSGGAESDTYALVQTNPWTAEVAEHCSVMGYAGRDYIGRAVAGLVAATPKAVEREFWSGTLAQAAGWPNLYLTDGNATDRTPTPGTAVSVEEGIDLLEAALAGCGSGGRGFIHVPPVVTPPLTLTRRASTANGELLLTQRDTIIVVGSGYAGTGPTGTAPSAGEIWLYATGMVDVRLGPIEVFGQVNGEQMWLGADLTSDGEVVTTGGFDPDRFTPSLVDRTTNDLIVPGRRPVAAAWDGHCHFAVLVNYPSGAE